MAYFLKKLIVMAKRLSIVDSFYDPSRGHTVHKTHSSYGTGEQLKSELAITDPIVYLQDLVSSLNFEKQAKKVAKISSVSPIAFAGHL